MIAARLRATINDKRYPQTPWIRPWPHYVSMAAERSPTWGMSMKNQWRFLVSILGPGVIFFSLAQGCASRDGPPALPEPDPIDIPLQPPSNLCVLPASLDSFETCRMYARCCDQARLVPPRSCSFSHADAGAECVCALPNGNEVRCKAGEEVTCECISNH